jgi:hypothetical protein
VHGQAAWRKMPDRLDYRAARVIGLALVAAGIGITFLNVSTSRMNFDTQQRFHVDCGSVWQAMFSNDNNLDLDCASAAVPHVWIAGGIAAVGMAIAFRGAGRGWLQAFGAFASVIFLTVVINMAGTNTWNKRGRRLNGPLRDHAAARPACNRLAVPN